MKKIRVSAPATIANLGPGFDVLGVAIDKPRDIVELELLTEDHVKIAVEGPYANEVPTSPKENVCVAAIRAVFSKLGEASLGFKLKLIKNVPPGMGLGSSGASSAAAAYAAYQLIKDKATLSDNELIECAMEGEKLATGSAHADNVAPSLLGGITAILSYDPLTIKRYSPPRGLYFAIAMPKLPYKPKEKTKYAREILPKQVDFKLVVKQLSGLAQVLTGLAFKELKTFGMGICSDHIVEPARAKLIPGFYRVKDAAMRCGAYGASISGAGPSVFAACSRAIARKVGEAMVEAFEEEGVEASFLVAKPSKEGAKVEDVA